jgi:hypothetical protein
MCFKNLPVEFDEDGNARLVLYPDAEVSAKPVVPIEDSPEKLRELLERNGWLPPEDEPAPGPLRHERQAV